MVLLWVRGGSNRWGWDAEVFRADLLKVWPKHAADASLPRLFGDATAPTEPHMLRKQLEDAVNWHNQPIPERTELRRLTEAVAELREAVGLLFGCASCATFRPMWWRKDAVRPSRM